ncbi:biotin/lipoate A/B protein ligase [Moraxella macacae 0408225]|uniref:Biotin/lipoate A/B protein ligase n=1 Tax=Moraxella macacae 0408225 TaxID=1230338 RepID=L2F9L1_9GAMM|nr:biotin--[acetyl-CoA-carboxylase] ligase [Moraxella macacae]ELA09461.1 biotin/lipoate A/B protein ligase [Moraxella macacae 0408225]
MLNSFFDNHVVSSDFLTPITHVHFDSIDSTNTALIKAVNLGNLPYDLPCLYTAGHQTAGRGQHGRTWVSGVNNVFLTLYVPIKHGEFDLYQLSGLLSLAVGLELTKLPVIQMLNENRDRTSKIGVKWANDIGYFDDTQFKKLAGVLIEPVFRKISGKNNLVGAVIGVGLNVNHAPEIKDGLYQSTCIHDLACVLTANQQFLAKDFYIPMTNQLLKAVQICNHCYDKDYLKSFINYFNENHLLTNKNINIFIQNNMTDVHASGQCIGISENGELLLKNNDTIIPIFAGMAKLKLNEN